MKSALLIIFLGFSQIANAGQVAQCLGTLVIDNSPVTAKIYSEEDGGKIVIETSFDSIQSQAIVDLAPNSTATISDNDFQMYFSVSQLQSSNPVQAFRDGAFFVEDFYCIRVN